MPASAMSFASGGGQGFIDFWSIAAQSLAFSTIATDVDLADIVVAGLPTGFIIDRVNLMMSVGCISISTSDNGLNGTQNISVKLSTGTFGVDDVIGMSFTTNAWRLKSSGYHISSFVIGNADLKSEVTGEGTYNVRWNDADWQDGTASFNPISFGLRIFFHL